MCSERIAGFGRGTALASHDSAMLYDPGFTGAHLGAIVMALLFAFAAFRQPRLGRTVYALLFAGVGIVNAWTAVRAPELYQYYADVVVIGWYRDFILDTFAQHTRAIVLSVAAAQAAIAVGLVLGGRPARAACWGATAFLVAVAPLGVGSGFPSTLILALGSARLGLRAESPRGALGIGLVAACRAALERYKTQP
jgi:hypothetical protein